MCSPTDHAAAREHAVVFMSACVFARGCACGVHAVLAGLRYLWVSQLLSSCVGAVSNSLPNQQQIFGCCVGFFWLLSIPAVALSQHTCTHKHACMVNESHKSADNLSS